MIQNPNNNLTVLPWYRQSENEFYTIDKNEFNSNKSYAYGTVYPLICPSNFILPFQIIRDSSLSTVITKVEIIDLNLSTVFDGFNFKDITSEMLDTGLEIKEFPDQGYNILIYAGIFPLPENLPQGQYYLKITMDDEFYYSELITFVADVKGFLKIEWKDFEDLVFDVGRIVYQDTPFKNILYLKTELGKPEYTFEEEGETRDGYFFPEKQISEKTYKFIALAPEYLCDVMRLIRMADYIMITDYLGKKYKCDTFLITPKWEVQGDLASIECEFQTNTVVKKIGKGFVITDGGGFNNDFNNDFNNN